ncbi:ABC transporter ATP-binding protein [Candidatus Roizmanbacteria bacterium RIFCSPLOWO2_12_FULL_40_12]|uniref:ABC transporter ATP-binding protein n=1 Tax=Candidatus Roizmanbacteria bacterium RIFCSPLOWO2_01_FULL_40_42 TaxID=1802066 RepID=A0A1F7J3N6_9BACT|nr:MAG: ABC transporter ATP-binding protein [Candidatus Roizmanbacteria bacterium RIFCSPHIGHO2_01_FULL_40_98]OGK28976.1 MAG: ABC transporter ATP-binding protein [Candidatus Roizmanbacteria bacterium RIFCSPHIGHO2_02_FULL_40_53]OGK29558.1 MAG: ABC transporter ATP-binding protein [Candidatus Roizmanbacteria bacterium RIFCSPHIGHO2_12_41_18]OGK37263.1 MAG: ABC transporter ATP-binding protein [Candidatus Roizmanbacteria bacterium RIFCSPHIGHO2_12_FULL_40_130]OGK50205.1 MAG: ABC transporter ATP-binding
MINLKNVYKEFQLDENVAYTALRNVTLTIKEGEFSSIIGPSGSGKSTLMHIIGLLDKASRGQVLVQGKDVKRLNDDELSTLRNEFVGFVFQQFNLINKLTVLENVLVPSIYARKKLKYDPYKKAMYLLERFGIAEKAKSYPNKISGGQQQRVAMARALIMEPKLILADEPTGNLDTKTGDEIMKLLGELNKKEKITVVIVTHEPYIAAKTKKQIRIVDGKIV